MRLTRVADNNNDPACAGHDVYGSKVSFEAVGGTTYDIAVGDAGGAREKPFGLIIAGSSRHHPPGDQDRLRAVGADHRRLADLQLLVLGGRLDIRMSSRLESGRRLRALHVAKVLQLSPLGAHTFEVRATDEAENVDPTPATRSFVVEAPSSPKARLQSTRLLHSQSEDQPGEGQRDLQVRFRRTGATFLCKLDRKPFRACKSPKTYRHLKPGKHRFQVEALDSTGNLDPTPAVRAFKLQP